MTRNYPFHSLTSFKSSNNDKESKILKVIFDLFKITNLVSIAIDSIRPVVRSIWVESWGTLDRSVGG